MWADGSDYVSQSTTSHGRPARRTILNSNFFPSISTSLFGQINDSFGFDDHINNCSQILISSGLTTLMMPTLLESFIDHDFVDAQCRHVSALDHIISNSHVNECSTWDVRLCNPIRVKVWAKTEINPAQFIEACHTMLLAHEAFRDSVDGPRSVSHKVVSKSRFLEDRCHSVASLMFQSK